MRTPSASLVISTLALVIATTGTGIAATKISGQSIRDHSIPASKLALHSVTAKQIKTHAITKATLADGVSDPAVGPAGPKGDTGPAGLIDRSKLAVVAGADFSLSASSDGVTGAACPAGTFLIGGGYTDLGTAQDVTAISSGPASDGSQAWIVHARNASTLNQSTPWHVIAYCVAAA